MKQLLENNLYGSRPIEEQRVYQIGDLESLSASALYWMPIDKKDVVKFGIVGVPNSVAPKVGSSSYLTAIPTVAPKMNLEVLTPKGYLGVSRQGVIPTAKDTLSYLDDEKPLGQITNLNPSEMTLLIKKHFGKD